MRQEAYTYVKGHCGWDAVTLLFGDEIPAGEEHRIANTLFAPPCTGGIEIGFMYPPEHDEDIRLRIIDSTTKTWLPMCGGMSQVIGLAAFQTDIQTRFALQKTGVQRRVNVQTDSGLVPIDITFDGNRPGRIDTQMPEYSDFLYRDGVSEVTVEGIPAIKVGYFLIFKLDDLQKAYPQAEFRHRGPGSDLELLGEIQMRYLRDQDLKCSTLYSMIYDLHPEEDGQARIFTRFFRGKGVPQATLLEAQCGTGTIAVGIAMAERNELPFSGNSGEVLFEWGSQNHTTDPYGLRKSILKLELDHQKVINTSFSHNIVELQSQGKVYLPNFTHRLF